MLDISIIINLSISTFIINLLLSSSPPNYAQYLLDISVLSECTQHHYFFLSSTDHCYGLLQVFPNQSVTDCSNIHIATGIFYMYFNVTIHWRKRLLHNSEVQGPCY